MQSLGLLNETTSGGDLILVTDYSRVLNVLFMFGGMSACALEVVHVGFLESFQEILRLDLVKGHETEWRCLEGLAHCIVFSSLSSSFKAICHWNYRVFCVGSVHVINWGFWAQTICFSQKQNRARPWPDYPKFTKHDDINQICIYLWLGLFGEFDLVYFVPHFQNKTNTQVT